VRPRIGGVCFVALPAMFVRFHERTRWQACVDVFQVAREKEWADLWVLPDPPSAGFYLKVGFSDTGERVPSRVPGGPILLSDLELHWSLCLLLHNGGPCRNAVTVNHIPDSQLYEIA